MLRYKSANMNILGAPVRDKYHTEKWIERKVNNKAVAVIENLHQLEDAQTQFLILNYCINFCKMVFFIRTISVTLVQSIAGKYDKLVINTFKTILGHTLNNLDSSNIRLSIKFG